MDKRFWAIIGVIIVIFGVVLFVQSNNKANAPSGSAKPTNHIKGAGDKKVTLVEYGDFQCPVCKSYYPVVEQVVTKYGDDIKFQFRNLPLTQLHQNAFAAARAAEAADKQGKYWEMYNMLYQTQESWSQSKQASQEFNKYAQQLGMNVDQFKKDFASNQINDAINADIKEFEKTKEAQATPSFFLNGKRIKPGNDVGAFTDLIDKAIAEQEKKQQ